MSKQPSTTDDRSTDTETEHGQPTDWRAVVLDAIEHLETASDDDTPAADAAFRLKAARDRLACLDASNAPDDVARRLEDVENPDRARVAGEIMDDVMADAVRDARWPRRVPGAPRGARRRLPTAAAFLAPIDPDSNPTGRWI